LEAPETEKSCRTSGLTWVGLPVRTSSAHHSVRARASSCPSGGAAQLGVSLERVARGGAHPGPGDDLVA